MKKSNKFAIIVDTLERVPNLIDVLNELNFKSDQQKVNLKDLLFGNNELVVFDDQNPYYEVLPKSKHILPWLDNIIGPKQYKVSKNFENIVEELYLFAGKSLKKEKKNMILNIEISLPRASKPKRKVRVFSNFVKVGWDQYRIHIDPFTGYEYVKINGKRYEVARDYFRQGYLIER
jgi:hypothetical protein